MIVPSGLMVLPVTNSTPVCSPWPISTVVAFLPLLGEDLEAHVMIKGPLEAVGVTGHFIDDIDPPEQRFNPCVFLDDGVAIL